MQRSPPRVDDRRILSGIIHVLRSGCRWCDCPPDYGPYTTVYNRFNRWSRKGIWRKIYAAITCDERTPRQLLPDSTHIKAHRSTAGKAYDSDAVREDLIERGTRAAIPNKGDRKYLHPFDKRRYRKRNAIEGMFCRLKDFRRIATRYDKLARNYLAGLCLAALVSCWLR